MTTKQPYTKSKRKFNSSKGEGTNSVDKDTPSNKKRALKQSRQSHRPHSEVVVTAKELWNKLRMKSNTKDDIAKLMDELMTLLRGKFNRIALQHDASRVVQSAIQFGTVEQRLEIVTEICSGSGNSNTISSTTGNIVELAKSQYSHFVVLKMIKYCKDDKSVNFLVKSFKGHINKLAVHAVGARVIELLFATLPPKFTSKLKLEVYGPRFTLFNDSITISSNTSTSTTSTHPTLQSIIQNQNNKSKAKDAALESLSSIIHKGIDKGLFSFAYFQQLLCEYVTVAPPSDVRALCPSLVDHSIHLLSTRSGSRVVAECAAYGTPKDRKRIMKSLKGYTLSSLLHCDAYIAILRLCDVTDDTVTVQKSILAELQVRPKKDDMKKKTVGPPDSDGEEEEDNDDSLRSPIIELALSETGSKLLLLLLAKDEESRKKYFDPAELEVLRANPTITENGEEVPTSKKNSKTRRMELLQYMKKILVQLCELHADELLRSRCGSKVMKEIHDTYPSKELTKAIVDACDLDRGSTTAADQNTTTMSMFEHPIGHLSLKNIILNESASSSNTKRENSLSSEVYLRYKGKLVEKIASSNRGAFVLAAMAEADDNARKEISINEIKKLIQVCKKDKKPVAGFEALLKVLKK
eukprot:CAMPEP_0203670650 /NCGR_PEP_ID=MMETSP0090-20130426/6661_1 /ASSEMBLY_ACC=CAM_ASM_001088 /TAXON_ID=426623 /ORGANISM="Chaetoceros affinis, Strain CCMP159" /LENGTH=636 /DNA_ID=CAMNT_0050535557 /DNA_START=100 /DNA_END=2010 /DNA_ORIENTATION=-